MELVSDPVVREEPHSSNRQPRSERTPASAVFGFPVAANQYAVLHSAESQSPGQREEGLVDPRTTRHLRQAIARVGNREVLETGGHSFTVSLENTAQGIFNSGTSVDPVAVELRSQFIPYSLSASSSDILLQSGEPVQYLLGTGANGGDALYDENVYDVACTDFEICNKRISCAGRNGRRGDRAIRPLGGF